MLAGWLEEIPWLIEENSQSVKIRVVYRTANNEHLVRSTQVTASIRPESLHRFLDGEIPLSGQDDPTSKQRISARKICRVVDNLGRLYNDISYFSTAAIMSIPITAMSSGLGRA